MLAILTTHPIQYQVPLWRSLAQQSQIDFEVWYLSDHGLSPSLDRSFGQTFAWDLDLLSGYRYCFLETKPNPPDITAFRGARIGSLNGLFQEHKVSALWINGWQVQAYWQAAFQAHRQGIPVWLRGETNDLRQSHWLNRLPRRLALGQLFQWVDKFLYIGTANKRFYRQFGVPESKLISAPYCVDNDRFAEAAKRLRPHRKEFRQQWSIPETATCFLFSGKFVLKKRPLDLLYAVERLLTVNPELALNIHVLLVGDGVLRSQLETVANKLTNLVGRSVVTFAGFLNQTEIPKAYVAADCLVLPSNAEETWGLVVNEAMASGCPVLVSDLCGCAEDLVRPLGNDFVFECGDIVQLMSRLHYIVKKKISLPNGIQLSHKLQSHHPNLTIRQITTQHENL